MDPMTTVAVAKVAGEVEEEAKGLIGKFLGPALVELGETLADHVRLVRLKSQITILRKATTILEREGLTPKAVQLKTLVSLLDAAAWEEDESMIDRWASLLASAADPRDKVVASQAFVEILRQLSPSEATVLDIVYAQVEKLKIPKNDWHQRGIVAATLQKAAGLQDDQFQFAVENCVRLRLIAYAAVKLDFISDKDARFQLTNSGLLCPTTLGFALVKACRGTGPHKETPTVATSDSAAPLGHTINTTPRWG